MILDEYRCAKSLRRNQPYTTTNVQKTTRTDSTVAVGGGATDIEG
jgi:hypothetical protein